MLPHRRKCLIVCLLVGFGTHHEFQNEFTTSTEVPLYLQWYLI